MLNSMRKGVKSWPVKILLGVMILSFGVWGVGDIFRGGSRAVLATIGGTKITQSALNNAYRREVQNLSAQLGRAIDPETASQLGLGQRAFQSLLSRTLLAEVAADYGLAISDAVLRNAIVSDPVFQTNDGRFDRAIFEQILFTNGLDEETYLSSLRGDLAREQLVSSIVAGTVIPTGMAEPIFRFREEARVADYFVIANGFFRDIEAADEAALEEYHRTNSQRYMAPELRAVTYIHLTPEALVSEIEVTEDELIAEYEARIDGFIIAEQRTVDQLLYADEDAARLARNRLVDGEDITAVAVSTGALNANAISLGVLTRDGLPDDLAEHIFALAPQEVGRPFQTLLGWHVVQVTDATPGGVRSLDEVRDRLTRDVALRAAADALFGLSNSIVDELASGATLEEAAGRLAFDVIRIEAMDQRGRDAAGNPIAGLPDGQSFVNFVFRSDVGFESSPEETSTGGYFIVRVDSAKPPAVRPLETVREQVGAHWFAGQQEIAAQGAANETLELLRAGRSFDSLAGDFDAGVSRTEPLRRAGREPGAVSAALAGALFTLRRGEYTVAPLSDGTGYVVARLDEIVGVEPGANGDRLDQLRASLANALVGDLMSQYQVAVSGTIGVDINQGLADAVLLGGGALAGGGGRTTQLPPHLRM